MHKDADEPEAETVEALVHEARENWGTTTDHERLQATGQAELHLSADSDGDDPLGEPHAPEHGQPPQPPA